MCGSDPAEEQGHYPDCNMCDELRIVEHGYNWRDDEICTLLGTWSEDTIQSQLLTGNYQERGNV